MIIAALLPNGKQQFLDGNGKPLAGGTVGMYVPTTLTAKTTWQDPDGSVANVNPVPLDADGSAVIYGSGQYRQIVKDLNGTVIWDELTYGLPATSQAQGFGVQTAIASEATTDLGTVSTNNALVTGTATIGSFGDSASLDAPIFLATFDDVCTITNSADIQCPGSVDISTTNGDVLLLQYLGGVVWQVIANFGATGSSGSGGFGKQKPVGAAATTSLATAGSDNLLVTGSGVNITSFGIGGDTSNPIFLVEMDDENIIEYDSVALQTPGSVDITTQTGDKFFVEYLGPDTWNIFAYFPRIGPPQQYSTLIGVDGTYTFPPAINIKTRVRIRSVGGGGGGGGAGSVDGAASGGGSSGAYGEIMLSGFSPGDVLTIDCGAGGTGGTAVGGDGGEGNDTTVVYKTHTIITAGKGHGGGGRTATGRGNPGLGGAFSFSLTGTTLVDEWDTTTNGLPQWQAGAGFGVGDATNGYSGNGGSNPLGSGGPGQSLATTMHNASGHGAGGQGGFRTGGTNSAGAAGTSGCVIVEFVA